MDSGEIQIFRFTRHMWGINSSPYVALMALNRLAADNPTHASMVTLNAIIQNRYMDDLQTWRPLLEKGLSSLKARDSSYESG